MLLLYSFLVLYNFEFLVGVWLHKQVGILHAAYLVAFFCSDDTHCIVLELGLWLLFGFKVHIVLKEVKLKIAEAILDVLHFLEMLIDHEDAFILVVPAQV